MGLLHYLYCKNYLQENWSLDLFFEVSFSCFFLSLYLYKFIIRPCMEYCCHVWVGAPSCYLELLDKLQRQICRNVGPSLAASLESLAHHQNVASLNPFYRYTLADVHLNWLSWFHFLILLVILIDTWFFLSPFLGVTRMSIVNSFFLCTSRLRNSLCL